MIISLTLLLTLTTIAIIIIASINKRMQSDILMTPEAGGTAFYPMRSGMVTIVPGVNILFDTSSPVSTLTKRDLDKLIAAGLKVDSIDALYFGYDPNDHLIFTTKRYRVNFLAPSAALTLNREVCTPFSTMQSEHAEIRNVDFIPTDDGVSRFGADFIRNFAVGYSWTMSMIKLVDHVPDDYQDFADLHRRPSVDFFLKAAPHYYIDLEVDGRQGSYLIDTTIPRVKINIPKNDGKPARRSYHDPFIHSGVFYDATCEMAQPVQIGNRFKYQDVHRSDVVDNGETYFCNPFNMFIHDIVLDMRTEKMYIRRGVNVAPHAPSFGIASH